MLQLKAANRLLALAPLLLITGAVILAQTGTPADVQTIRIRTRVVSFPVTVVDKRTGTPVTNLTADDFEVRDDNKLRPVAYFSQAQDAKRKPLALMFVFDLWARGAGRYLSDSGPLTSLASALMKLPPQDEVGFMVTDTNGGPNDMTLLSDFTRDRASIASLLTKVTQAVPSTPFPGGLNLESAMSEISQMKVAERPNSDGIIVYISDGTNVMLESLRDENITQLLRSNITVNALVCHQLDAVKVGMVSLKPLFALGGLRENSLPHYASRTGGESFSVHNADDYGKGLETILANLTSRYSLGFALDEKEPGDGRFHKLTVRVTVRDTKGKKIAVKVLAPAGYYMPLANGSE